MEKREQLILEALLGIILILLLIIIIFLFTSTENQSTNTTPTTITNSFNTNNYYNTQKYSHYTKTDYKKTLDYNHKAYKKKTQGILGNDIEHYIINIKNQAHKPGYFQVTYRFTDYYGDTETETITHYIKPKQTKQFTYKNIHQDKYKFHSWDYKITSKLKKL